MIRNLVVSPSVLNPIYEEMKLDDDEDELAYDSDANTLSELDANQN